MTLQPIWFFTSGTPGTQNETGPSVAAWLERAGLTFQKTDSLEKTAGPGLFLLTEITKNTYSILKQVSQSGEQCVLVLLANEADASGETAWRLMQNGASDVVVWQDTEELAAHIRERFMRWQEINRLLNSSLVRDNLVGQSRVWLAELRKIIEAARYTQEPVLLVGDTGTGKELAARLIHTLDRQRKKHNLVIVDCTTIVPELAGSELFGHERGAFTGAVSSRDGAFATADGGSLFLDEVGELPQGLQIQLLRALQEKTYKRVGSNAWRKTDFRLICATNRDMGQEVEAGRFRPDLYFRIAGWKIQLPPLRERLEDIPLLVRHFLKEAGGYNSAPELDQRVVEFFLRRPYPGNVRDLKNLVYRVTARQVGHSQITLGDIPPDEWASYKDEMDQHFTVELGSLIRVALAQGLNWEQLNQIIRQATRQAALEMSNGDLRAAAKLLGVTPRTLQNWRMDQDNAARLMDE